MTGHFIRTYELWRATVTQDAIGAPEKTFNKVADIPGRAYPKTAKDLFAASTVWGVIDWKFACSAVTDIKPGDEIHFDGRKLRVLSVPVTSAGDRIEAPCRELQ